MFLKKQTRQSNVVILSHKDHKGFSNVAVVIVLPVPMLPVPNWVLEIGYWQHFHIGNIQIPLPSMHSAFSADCPHSSTPNSSTILHAFIHNERNKERQECQPSTSRQTAHKPRCRPEGTDPVFTDPIFMTQRNHPRNDRCRRANGQKRCPNLHHDIVQIIAHF